MSLYLATWNMPGFTTKDEAKVIGEACGLRMIEFTRGRNGCRAIFKAKTISAVNTMFDNLGYPPDSVRKFPGRH